MKKFEEKYVQDRKNGKVYLVCSNGDMEEKAPFAGTVAVFLKNWVSENYDDFIDLTEKEAHAFIYFGVMPKLARLKDRCNHIWSEAKGHRSKSRKCDTCGLEQMIDFETRKGYSL